MATAVSDLREHLQVRTSQIHLQVRTLQILQLTQINTVYKYEIIIGQLTTMIFHQGQLSAKRDSLTATEDQVSHGVQPVNRKNPVTSQRTMYGPRPLPPLSINFVHASRIQHMDYVGHFVLAPEPCRPGLSQLRRQAQKVSLSKPNICNNFC